MSADQRFETIVRADKPDPLDVFGELTQLAHTLLLIIAARIGLEGKCVRVLQAHTWRAFKRSRPYAGSGAECTARFYWIERHTPQANSSHAQGPIFDLGLRHPEFAQTYQVGVVGLSPRSRSLDSLMRRS